MVVGLVGVDAVRLVILVVGVYRRRPDPRPRAVVQDFTFRDSYTLLETVAKAQGRDLTSRILNLDWYFLGAQKMGGGGYSGWECCASGDPCGPTL